MLTGFVNLETKSPHVSKMCEQKANEQLTLDES